MKFLYLTSIGEKLYNSGNSFLKDKPNPKLINKRKKNTIIYRQFVWNEFDNKQTTYYCAVCSQLSSCS